MERAREREETERGGKKKPRVAGTMSGYPFVSLVLSARDTGFSWLLIREPVVMELEALLTLLRRPVASC